MFLRQSSTFTDRIGPFLDATDGVTEEVGLTTAAAAIFLSPNGGNFVAKNESTAIAHDQDGWYVILYDATDTATVGKLEVMIQAPGTHLPVWKTYWVLEENVYDALFAASASQGTDLAALITTVGTAGDGLTEAGATGNHLSAIPWNAAWDAEVQSEVNDALVALRLDHLVAVADADDVVDNSIIARLADSGATADWSAYVQTTDSLRALRDHIADGSNLTEAGATGNHLSAIPWNASWDAEVQSEVNDALVALGLDHLVGASVTGTDVVDNSIFARLVSASATADWDDFVHTTDSLQNIRDEIVVVDGVVDGIPTTAMRGTDNAALASVLGALNNAAAVGDVTTSDTLMQYVKQLLNELSGAVGIGAMPAAADPANGINLFEMVRRIFDDSNAIEPITTALTSAAAAKLALTMASSPTFTVDGITHTPTTTEFEADDITEATADHFIGRIMLFTSGALDAQATDITDYALVGSNGHFTVTALTEAPANNGTGIII